MDFDDLLADPFKDPFAKPRSGSPDPWASFSHQPSETQDAFAEAESSYDDGRSTTPTTESYVTGDRGESSPSSTSDPLESAAVNADDEESKPNSSSSPQAPGFRESISALNPSDHTQTISEPEPDSPPLSKGFISHTEESSKPASPPPPVARAPSPPISAATTTPIASPSLTTSKTTKPVVSPLEQPATVSNLNNSFAGLALGGESIGGWQTDQGSWGNEAASASVSNISSTSVTEEEDEDDDDDVPIGSRLGSPNLVSVFRSGSDNTCQSPSTI